MILLLLLQLFLGNPLKRKKNKKRKEGTAAAGGMGRMRYIISSHAPATNTIVKLVCRMTMSSVMN